MVERQCALPPRLRSRHGVVGEGADPPQLRDRELPDRVNDRRHPDVASYPRHCRARLVEFGFTSWEYFPLASASMILSHPSAIACPVMSPSI